MRARSILFVFGVCGISAAQLAVGCVADSRGLPDAGDTGVTLTDVSGKIVDEFGAPVANAKIGVGAVIATSGADGSFRVMAPPTYDATVVSDNGTLSTGKRVTAFMGLTTRSPSLQVFTQQRHMATAVVSNTMRTPTMNERIGFLFIPNAASHTSPMGAALMAGAGTGMLGLQWGGAPTMSGTVYAMQLSPPGANGVFPIPTAFNGGDIQPFMGLADGMQLNLATWSFVASPTPVQMMVNIAYNGTTGTKLNLVYRPDANSAAGFTFDDEGFKGETQRTFIAPNPMTPYKAGVIVVANTASGGVAVGWKVGVVPQMGGMTNVTLPATDVTLTEPADGAMIDKTTTLAWSAVPNAVYRVVLTCPQTGAPQASIDILTSQTSVRVPESSALGAVFSGMQCRWAVMAFPAAKTADDLAGPAGWQALSDSFRSMTDSWNVASKFRAIAIK